MDRKAALEALLPVFATDKLKPLKPIFNASGENPFITIYQEDLIYEGFDIAGSMFWYKSHKYNMLGYVTLDEHYVVKMYDGCACGLERELCDPNLIPWLRRQVLSLHKWGQFLTRTEANYISRKWQKRDRRGRFK